MSAMLIAALAGVAGVELAGIALVLGICKHAARDPHTPLHPDRRHD